MTKRDDKMAKSEGLSFEAAVAALSRALGQVSGAIKTNSTLAVLSHVLLRAETTPEGGRVHVSAYDLELGLLVTIPAKVVREGTVLVPFKLFSASVSRSAESVVSVEAKARNRVGLSSGSCKMEIVGMPNEDALAFPEAAAEESFSMTRDALLGMVGFVESAICTNVGQQAWCGVRLTVEDRTVQMTSYDNHQCAVRTLALDVPIAKPMVVTVPEKAIVSLKKALASENGAVSIGLTHSAVVVRSAGLVLIARLVEGDFPDVQAVHSVVKEGFVVNRARLVEAIGRVQLVAGGGSMSIGVQIQPNTVRLTARGVEGNAMESVVVESDSDTLFFLNATYALAALAVFDAETIRVSGNDSSFFRVTDPSNPACIRLVGLLGANESDRQAAIAAAQEHA